LYRDKTRFQLVDAEGLAQGAPRWPPGSLHRDDHFGETVVYFEQIEVPLPLTRTDTTARSIALRVDFQGCQINGICYRPMSRTLQIDLPAIAVAPQGDFLRGVGAASAAISPSKSIAADAAPTTAKPAIAGFWLSLLLAFAGGLILNLMPCVLPVLSFKALGLAESGRSHDHAKAHALWYSLGVLASFAAIGVAVLTLRGAGQALGWGFQLQQPSVVAALTLLLFAIGLSLSGLFQFGAGLAGIGQSLTQKSGALGDFFTGVLAVVVASPCTAPFMGTALGYAFTAPALAALTVFLALGLGMALPFLLIGFVPALAARLPKPGAWMETLRQWLAYPMYFTAIWLAWVFGKQRGVDALALLLIAATLLALGVGWYERRRYLDGALKKALAYIVIAAALGAVIAALRVPAETRATLAEKGEAPYSAVRLAALRAEGRPVFVNMTADWCITCKVNEKAVLGTSEFKALLERSGTVYLVGDWTNEDPEISAFLDQFNTPGVPLYVVFPADGGPGHKLPQLLSQGLLREALEPTAN
jgi:thiol:disulfide interchange protein DsbD